MIKSRLIILTRRFPFFKAEAFLESELPFIANFFDEVLIFPSEIGEKSRSIPKNVFVQITLALEFKKKIRRSIKTILSPYFWKLFVKDNNLRKSNLVYIFHFASRVLAYEDFFNKNAKLFNNSLIYSYWLNEAPLAFLYSKKKMGMSSIIVSRAHRYDVYEGGTDMVTFWPKRDFLLKNIEKVFPISDNAKLYLDERFNSKDKTIVSKLGVFDNHAISKSSNSGMFHIVSVSRLDKVKRVGFILKSLENLSNKLHETEIKWTHFGGGSLYNELKSESARITVKNLKIEFKGIVDNSKIYEFYRESSVDCFINLSSSEGIPVSIMEAQSFGIPTVATDVGGTSEIVTEENGILLKSNPTIEEVTDALTKIYYNKPDRKLIKENWNKNFNAERNYVQFAKDLLKLSESLHYGM